MTLGNYKDFNAFSGADGKPTEAERKLIEAMQSGTGAFCADLPDDERRISADLIAALATGRFRHRKWPDWSQDAVGLWLVDAVIAQRLTLENQRVTVKLSFRDCDFKNGFDFDGASFDGDLFLRGCRINGLCRTVSANISGQFSADGSTFDNTGELALAAQNVVAADWHMNGTTVSGGFDINGARIAGQFSAGGGALFTNRGGTAISAQSVKAGGWFMTEAIVEGKFDINSAEIAGHFVASGNSVFDNPGDVAIDASHLKAASWSMDGGSVNGCFDIYQATIQGGFGAERTTFTNPSGVAISGHSSSFAGGIFLRDGTSVAGYIDLAGSTIGRVLDLSDAHFSAAAYSTLRLQAVSIEGDAIFSNSTFLGHIYAARAKFDGLVRLDGAILIAATEARRQGKLSSDIGEASNKSDATRQRRLRHHALVLEEARIGGRLVMPDRCPEGIVDLSHARCAVLEDCERGWPKPVSLKTGRASGRLYFTEAEEEGAASGEGRKADIQHLVLDGFEYGYFEYPDGDPSKNLVDEHGKPRIVREDPATARKKWLAAQSADDLILRFNPQPWRQAATVLRAMGHDRASQTISIERRVRERYARDMPKRQKFVSWLLHLVADYGFNPWKTVAISVGVVLLWAAAYWAGTTLCGDPNLRVEGQCGGQPLFVAVQHGDVDTRFADTGGYPAFGHIAYSLDAFVPLFDFGTETYWRPNALAWADIMLDWPGLAQPTALKIPLGYLLHWLFIVERFLGAILIAIAVTGFTGLLTRDEK